MRLYFTGVVSLVKAPNAWCLGEVLGVPLYLHGESSKEVAGSSFAPAWWVRVVSKDATMAVDAETLQIYVDKGTGAIREAWPSDAAAIDVKLFYLRAINPSQATTLTRTLSDFEIKPALRGRRGLRPSEQGPDPETDLSKSLGLQGAISAIAASTPKIERKRKAGGDVNSQAVHLLT